MFLVVPVTLLGMERTKAEVGALVAQRRLEIGYSEKQLMDLTRIDRKTLAALEDGTRWPQEETRFKIEKALRWPLGSIEKARADAKWTPIPLPEPTPIDPLEAVSDDELLAEIRRRMRGERNVMEANASAGASSKASKEKEDLAALSPPEIDDVTVTESITPDLGEHSEDTGSLGGSPGGGGDVEEDGPDAAAQG